MEYENYKSGGHVLDWRVQKFADQSSRIGVFSRTPTFSEPYLLWNIFQIMKMISRIYKIVTVVTIIEVYKKLWN